MSGVCPPFRSAARESHALRLPRSFEVLIAQIPLPDAVPKIHYAFNEYAIFDLNPSAIWIGLYVSYYLMLDPVAAVRCARGLVLIILIS